MFKHLILASMLLTSVSAFSADKKATDKMMKPKTEKFVVDPAQSKVVYLGKKVTGEHTGEVKISSGHVTLENGSLKDGEVVVDMTTINNSDITDKEYNKKFVDHMNSDDFFSTAKHKTAKFTIKSATKVKDNNYKVTGDLTIKGKTSPITFDAEVTSTKATAVVKFDRTTYDIKYGSGKFFQGLGDKMINDEVQLTVTLTAKK